MRRLLRLSDTVKVTEEQARSAFQTSVFISSIRCTLSYVVLPFIAPLIGLSAAVGAPLGIAISLVAMVSITFSMRRFFGSDHPKRWWYAVLGGSMFCFVTFMLIRDVASLLT